MQKRKKYSMTTGHYFFSIKMGYQNNISISRETREAAEYAFTSYLKQKKECEWLGQWNGKKFVDSDFKNAA